WFQIGLLFEALHTLFYTLNSSFFYIKSAVWLALVVCAIPLAFSPAPSFAAFSNGDHFYFGDFPQSDFGEESRSNRKTNGKRSKLSAKRNSRHSRKFLYSKKAGRGKTAGPLFF
ncbi:MAG: hypothetical protein Q4C86_14645, partial [bacterium]|nr:hypothetical protein [bacterium]